MAKDFSFPFYVGDWLSGTMYFTIEQKGAYLELLLLQFNHGPFTEQQAKQVLNISFSNCWPTVREKFKTAGDKFYNSKMEEVKTARQSFVESRRNNRLGKVKQEPTPIETNFHKKNTSKTSVNHLEDENKSKDESKSLIVKTPLEIAFDEFLVMRKKIKKPATERAIELVKSKLVQLSNNDEELAIKILNQSIVSSWQDIYPLKPQNNATNQNQHTNRNDRESERVAGIEQLREATTAILNNGGGNTEQ